MGNMQNMQRRCISPVPHNLFQNGDSVATDDLAATCDKNIVASTGKGNGCSLSEGRIAARDDRPLRLLCDLFDHVLRPGSSLLLPSVGASVAVHSATHRASTQNNGPPKLNNGAFALSVGWLIFTSVAQQNM
eukprot:3065274-Rhodomonas_salina.2